MDNKLYILVGIDGSNRSEFALKLKERENGVIVRDITSASDNLSAGKNTIVDLALITKDLRAPYIKLARGLNLKIVSFAFISSLESVMSKNPRMNEADILSQLQLLNWPKGQESDETFVLTPEGEENKVLKQN